MEQTDSVVSHPPGKSPDGVENGGAENKSPMCYWTALLSCQVQAEKLDLGLHKFTGSLFS